MKAGQTQQETCTPTFTHGFAEHTSLPVVRENWEDKDFADPIEDFSEDDQVAAAGRSPKHPRTGSEEDGLDVAAVLDRAADRLSACMDIKVDSMMDRLEKTIDERIDSKLGPVMDRLTAQEVAPPSRLSMVGLLDTMVAVAAHCPWYLLPLFWRLRVGVDFETGMHMV